MGSVCQCPEGIYDDIEIKNSKVGKIGKHSLIRKNSDQEEEKLLRSNKLNSKKTSSLIIDKEISMTLNTVESIRNKAENVNRNDLTIVEDLGMNKSIMFRSEIQSRRSSFISKLITFYIISYFR